MIAINKINDDDDKVNNDAVQGRSEEESEIKRPDGYYQKRCFSIRYIRTWGGNMKKTKRYQLKKKIFTEEEDDDLIHSDNDQDTNNEESEKKTEKIKNKR